MPPDTQGQSPFAPQGFTRTPPPSTERPEPPRLGILHLMVLTACVAVWMGVMRTMVLAAEGDLPGLGSDPLSATAGTLYGIGGGSALAGLVLFFARRWRGMRFPVHPGEYLLMITAIGVVLQAAIYPVYLAIYSLEFSDVPPMWPVVVLGLGTFAINAALFIWALVCVKRRRWRIFLLSIPVCHLVGYGLMWMSVRTAGLGLMSYAIPNLAPLAAGIVLSVVVIQDHVEGTRYPWSHWMGVALRLWFDFVRIVSSVWIIMRWDAGF